MKKKLYTWEEIVQITTKVGGKVYSSPIADKEGNCKKKKFELRTIELKYS